MEGYIYVLRAAGTNNFKIGRTTKNVEARVAELQTGSPHKLLIVAQAFCSNSRQTEAMLHKEFVRQRVQGEWFELESSDLILEHLQSILNPQARSELFYAHWKGDSAKVSDLFSVFTPQTQINILLLMVTDLTESLRRLEMKHERLAQKAFDLEEELVQANQEINRLNGLDKDSWKDLPPVELRSYRVWE